MKKKDNEITVYDQNDTTDFIDQDQKKSLKDLDFELPPEPPTKVITRLYHLQAAKYWKH